MLFKNFFRANMFNTAGNIASCCCCCCCFCLEYIFLILVDFFNLLLLRIDDIEDNSKLRRGIPGNVGKNKQSRPVPVNTINEVNHTYRRLFNDMMC